MSSSWLFCLLGPLCCCATSATEFDCDDGLSSWQDEWSDAKQAWCCLQQSRGCPGSRAYVPKVKDSAEVQIPGDPYDCDVGIANLQEEWTEARQLWCCFKHASLCPAVAKAASSIEARTAHDSITTTATLTNTLAATVTTATSLASTTQSMHDCDAVCVRRNDSFTCRQRIRWCYKNLYDRDRNGCNKSHEKVLNECSVCSQCQYEPLLCTVELESDRPGLDTHTALYQSTSSSATLSSNSTATSSFFSSAAPPTSEQMPHTSTVRSRPLTTQTVTTKMLTMPTESKLQSTLTATTSSPLMEALSAEVIRVLSAKMGYRCMVGSGHREEDWSIGKRAFCCHTVKMGCPRTAARSMQQKFFGRFQLRQAARRLDLGSAVLTCGGFVIAYAASLVLCGRRCHFATARGIAFERELPPDSHPLVDAGLT